MYVCVYMYIYHGLLAGPYHERSQSPKLSTSSTSSTYVYIYIYNVARHFTNTAQMSGRCVLQAFVVDFYIFIVTVFLFFFF